MNKEQVKKIKTIHPETGEVGELEVSAKCLGLFEKVKNRDGAWRIVEELKKIISPEEIMEDTLEQKTWELFGGVYKENKRYFEAIHIYSSLYEHMLEAQRITGKRVHKGMPLCWLYDCFSLLGYSAISKRYLMLTLIEDAITTKNNINPDNSGVYFRLVWQRGLPENEFYRYSGESYGIYKANTEYCIYPEWVLQNLDQEWMTEFPSNEEGNMYFLDKGYAEFFKSKLGDDSGRSLEYLASYLMSCIPGCRTRFRQKTYSTDYDVICNIDGNYNDFRSEWGRIFVCECKDYEKNSADFTDTAKFIQVLNSTKSRFGIIFLPTGISGKNKALDSERELLKIFQDKGIVITVIDSSDIESVCRGASLINLLRKKYEVVRLDLKKY